jgi:hypothetical protein
MSYEQIRQATLAGTRDAIAKGATERQIQARAAKMRADAMLCKSYDDEPMGAWPAFILKTADEVEALGKEIAP